MWKLLALGVCAACGLSKPAMRATQQPIGNTGVTAVIRATGLYVGDKLALGPDQLISPDAIASALEAASPQSITFDIEAAPASVGYAVLVATRDMKLQRRRKTADGQEREFAISIAARVSDEDSVKLSIEIKPDSVVIGLARVEEFQYIQHTPAKQPDLERLRAAIELHKPTAFFADRTDIEVAVAPNLASNILLDVAELVSRAGFTTVEVMRPDELTARATAPAAVDVTGMRRADDVLATLRKHAGGGVELRAGADLVCPRIDILRVDPDTPQPAAKTVHITFVRSKRPVWIAFGFTDRETFNKKEVALGDVQATIAGHLGNPFVAQLPMIVAADSAVDATTLVSVLRAICATGVSNLEIATPKTLPLKP